MKAIEYSSRGLQWPSDLLENQTSHGVEPLSVDLVNDIDAILELPNNALVT